MLSETHYYDGKLERTKLEMKAELDRATIITFDNKQRAFQCLKTYLEEKYSAHEMQILARLIGETDKYYDPVNDLYVDQLLYLCYEKIVLLENDEFLDNFKRQLQDMISGFCAQGRTVRLLQLLLAFE